MATETPVAPTRETLPAALVAQIQAEGASAERERVKAVRAQLVPGHEALIELLVADGKSTAGDAALAIVAATQKQTAAAAAAHAADAPAAAPNATAANDERTKKTKAEWTAEAKAYASKNNVEFMAALKAIGYPD